MLNFVQCFFCIYWDDHIFIFHFVCHLSQWYVDVELSLHPYNKSYLDHGMNLLMYCWIQSANILLRNFFNYVHQEYWPVIFFSCGILFWFCYQGNADHVKWICKCSLLFYFFKSLRRISINLGTLSRIYQ